MLDNQRKYFQDLNIEPYNRCLDLIDHNICYFCEKPIDPQAFTEESLAEYKISCMCHACFEKFGRKMRADFDAFTKNLSREQVEDLMDFIVNSQLAKRGIKENDPNL